MSSSSFIHTHDAINDWFKLFSYTPSHGYRRQAFKALVQKLEANTPQSERLRQDLHAVNSNGWTLWAYAMLSGIYTQGLSSSHTSLKIEQGHWATQAFLELLTKEKVPCRSSDGSGMLGQWLAHPRDFSMQRSGAFVGLNRWMHWKNGITSLDFLAPPSNVSLLPSYLDTLWSVGVSESPSSAQLASSCGWRLGLAVALNRLTPSEAVEILSYPMGREWLTDIAVLVFLDSPLFPSLSSLTFDAAPWTWNFEGTTPRSVEFDDSHFLWPLLNITDLHVEKVNAVREKQTKTSSVVFTRPGREKGFGFEGFVNTAWQSTFKKECFSSLPKTRL